jgi:small multidrug resistance family-3 protein
VTGRSIGLFIAAAMAEICGAYLMWQAVKEGRGLLFALAGAAALAGYGAIAALQPDANFGRVLAAYGGVFIVGSLAWGMVFDGFRPDRYDLVGRRRVPDRRRGDHVRAARLIARPPSETFRLHRSGWPRTSCFGGASVTAVGVAHLTVGGEPVQR